MPSIHIPNPTEDTLSTIMDFDTVIRVNADGSIDILPDIYAPTLYDGELDSQEWSLLNGFSGQWRYAGPIMHESEFIGGGLARYILTTPGLYVCLVSYFVPESEDHFYHNSEIDGWAVAYKEESN